MSVYDLIVIGGGPAGLTAGLYASRAQMKTLLFERMMTGGQAASTEWIENYPGFEQGISGAELASKMEAQARRFGLEVATASVTDVRTDEKPMAVVTDSGEFKTRSLIVASGSDPKKLNVPGEAEFRGKGVSYCATCDGPFFKEKDVVTVGGGSSGVQESLYLTRFVKSIRLVEFTDRLNAEKILQQRARENGKISVFLGHRVVFINGAKKVESVTVENRADGSRSDFKADGVFIWVGLKPNSEFLNGRLPLDAIGGILTDADMATKIPGVFAAGDVRAKTVRQVSTAVGDATIAAESALHYVESFG